MKATTNNKSNIRELRQWFKTLLAYQLDPRWITDPTAQRNSRPAILGPEGQQEKLFNDQWCAKFGKRPSSNNSTYPQPLNADDKIRFGDKGSPERVTDFD